MDTQELVRAWTYICDKMAELEEEEEKEQNEHFDMFLSMWD